MTLEFAEIRILTQQNYKAIAAINEDGTGRTNAQRQNALADGGSSILDTASRNNSFGRDIPQSKQPTGNDQTGP